MIASRARVGFVILAGAILTAGNQHAVSNPACLSSVSEVA
jgi:hypothetical protein